MDLLIFLNAFEFHFSRLFSHDSHDYFLTKYFLTILKMILKFQNETVNSVTKKILQPDKESVFRISK